jgi:hypothetical protein
VATQAPAASSVVVQKFSRSRGGFVRELLNPKPH